MKSYRSSSRIGMANSIYKTCLDALLKQTYAPIEIIIVDNASEDGSQAYIREHYPQVTLIELPENRGFTGGM
jgi:GT2 family glycosyltransferase